MIQPQMKLFLSFPRKQEQEHKHHLGACYGLPRWLNLTESACQAGHSGSIPGLGRCLGEENGNSLQYSCLGNPMDRGAWRATVHGVSKRHDLVTKHHSKELIINTES